MPTSTNRCATPIVVQDERGSPAGGIHAASAAQQRLRVWLLDPWCRTPWYTAELTLALGNLGQSVRMVCPSYHLEPEYFGAMGLQPRPGPFDLTAHFRFIRRQFLRPARLVEYAINRSVLQVNSFVRPPQIVHQQQCVLLENGWRSELNFLRWCRSRGARIVCTVHNLLPHRAKKFHVAQFGELYRFCDALICHDVATAEKLHDQFGVESQRLFIIPHGPLFAQPPALSPQECRSALSLPEDRPLFLALGVLAPYKGNQLLLVAWKKLLRLDKDTQRPLLVIAGNGPESEQAALRAKAAALGLSAGDFRLDFGYIPAKMVPMYLQAADVLVYPYQAITTSGSLLTGLNYRKPIVASDLAAFRPYLHEGENALLVPPDDLDGLCAALKQMLNPVARERMWQGCRRNLELLVQWDEIARRTVRVYESLAG